MKRRLQSEKLEEPKEQQEDVTIIARVVDPFENTSIQDLPTWWRVTMGCVGIVLFPVRFVLLIFVLVPLTLIFLLPFCSCFDRCCASTHASMPVALAIESDAHDDLEPGQPGQPGHQQNTQPFELQQDQPEPHNPCRSCAVYPIRLMARLTLWCLGFWWITVKRLPGSATKSSERPVIVANHTSLLDAMVMTWFFAPMSVAKSGVQNIPVASGIATALQTIFVNRQDPTSKKKTLQEIKRRTSDERYPSLCVYPEGTTTNGKCLVQFKKGAFTSNKPVQPIVLQYTSTFLNLSANGDMANMALGFTVMMLQPFNHVTVSLLPRHVPTVAEQDNAMLFANNVRQEMASFMQVPVTEHSYEDVFFLTHLKKKRQWGKVTQNFEMSQLKSKYELSFDEIKLMLDKFAMITSLNQEDTHLREEQRAANGLLYHEFCSLLKLKEDQRSSEMLFHFFDVSDDGVIDFVEFVRGISLLSGRVSDVERLKLAFAMLDTDEDGKIGLIELKEYLNDAIRVDQVRLVLETNGNGKDGDGRRGGEKQKEIHEAGTVVEEVEEESGGSSNTLRQSSLDSCFDAIDDDHDGRVNLEEFVLLAHEKTTLIGPLLEMAKEFIVLAMELEMGMETKEGEECRGETKSKVVENKELQLPI